MLIEDRLTGGAADGFNIVPPLLPEQLDVFSAEVIPILEQRGLLRTEYAGPMLREHYDSLLTGGHRRLTGWRDRPQRAGTPIDRSHPCCGLPRDRHGASQ
jgi:hypothetical protein